MSRKLLWNKYGQFGIEAGLKETNIIHVSPIDMSLCTIYKSKLSSDI